MKKTAAMTMITLMGAVALGCEVEEQEPEATPAAEQDRIQDQTPRLAPGDQQGVTIRVDSLDGSHPYITDGDGRALYAIEGEPEGESTCYDECAREWPPFVASGDEGQAAPGAPSIRADRLGTLERRDGDLQVTYDGRALYYYHDDQRPGQTEGHQVTDQWGEWYLVRPEGELLEEHQDSGQ